MIDNKSLAELLEKNYISAFRECRLMEQCEWFENDNLTWIDSGLSMPFMNGVFTSKSIDENEVQKVIEVFSKRKRDFFWRVGETTENKSETVRLLELSGFSKTDFMKGMVLREFKNDIKISDNLKIVKVQSEEELASWFHVWKTAFEMTNELKDFYYKWFVRYGFDKTSPFSSFAGFYLGELVSIATVYVEDSFAGIFNVATLPKYRQKGFAETLTQAAICEALERNQKNIGLFSSHMAHSLYEKMGFSDVTETGFYALNNKAETR